MVWWCKRLLLGEARLVASARIRLACGAGQNLCQIGARARRGDVKEI